MRRPPPPPGSPYPTPEAEYVEGPGVGLRELAVKWGIGFRTIARWSTGNDWAIKRQRFQADIERQARERRVARYVRQRERVHDGNARLARALRSAVEARLSGQPTARDLASLSAAFARVARELRVAYGLEAPTGIDPTAGQQPPPCPDSGTAPDVRERLERAFQAAGYGPEPEEAP
ncbi:MAG: hypothetical protein HY814_13660 [Candidatus Riflebacteria bacterium]|nr:hypothetical protein [Candidatus Riflebacteria bacterium]